MNPDKLRIALLIDADNSPAELIDEILTELSTVGVIDIRRAYGNWTKHALNKWQDRLLEFAIRPMQQFDYSKGKNASDMAMTVDAMELLYTERPDAFALASSDADFTPLVMHLRAKGAAVYGFGAAQTPKPFVNACSRFLYLEALRSASQAALDAGEEGGVAELGQGAVALNLADAAPGDGASSPAAVAAGGKQRPGAEPSAVAGKAKPAPGKGAKPATQPANPDKSRDKSLEKGPEKSPAAQEANQATPVAGPAGDGQAPSPPGVGLRVPTLQLRQNTRLMNGLRSAVQANADEEGWVRVNVLGQQIANKESFDARNFGYGSLSKLLVATNAFEVREEGTSRVAVRVRVKR